MSLRPLALVAAIGVASALATVFAAAAAAQEEEPPEPALIVKFRDEGRAALRDCAERLFHEGQSFDEANADDARDLDALLRDARPRSILALFRRPGGGPFPEERRRLARRLASRARKARGRQPLPSLAHVYRMQLAAGADAGDTLERLRADPHVEWAQPDHVHEIDQAPAWPDDPFLYSSGSWGQAFEDLWGLHRIRAPEAWALSQGEGVVVAVVDTGLDYDHPDIAANVWVHPGEDLDGNGVVDESDWNGIDDDGNGFVDDLRGFDFANSLDADRDGRFDGEEDESDPDPFDDNGHGTHVAGTIAAVADNGIGIAGVAPRARIMPLKGFSAEGRGRDSDLWRAVLYAAENGARVVNNSWSCNPLCPDNPLAEEIVSIAHAMGVAIVTSAGNRITDVVLNSPEKLRETITVGSSGQDDRLSSSFSNFGWLVDLVAPGGGPSDDPAVRIPRRNILSLRSSADLSAEFATVAPGYWRTSGTSMAAPHVAGVAALLLARDPDLGYEELRRVLRQSAADVGAPGHDRWLGAGRLDALAALERGPLPDLEAAITGPRQGSVFAPREVRSIEIEGRAAGQALARWELHYGLGNDPAEWIPLASGDRPAPEGPLAVWPVESLPEGTWVVRLDVWSHEGDRYSEFLVVSLEHNRFQRISLPGPPAALPSISGRRVVWQSRRDPDVPDLQTEDWNLFASRFPAHAGPATRHSVVSAGPGDQTAASIAGRTISWLDTRGELGLPEVYACRLLPGRPCPGLAVAPGATTSLPPVSVPGFVYWLGNAGGRTDVLACALGRGGRSCPPLDTGLEDGRRGFLRGDGRGLVWVAAGSRIGLCTVDPTTGRCPERAPPGAIPASSRPTASGSLLAWVSLSFSGPGTLRICELDEATHACDPIDVADDVEDATPTLSGRRLVWDARTGDEASDVFFCEYDSHRRRCPVQRLTAHHAPQQDSDVDGDLVVWQDDRAGASEIHGIRLPSLKSPGDRRLRAGSWLALPVRTTPRGAPLSLAATSVGADGADAPVEAVGARFLTRRRGRGEIGLLLWRPRDDQVGERLFTFSGTTAAGLATHETVRVEVTPRRPGKRTRHRR